MLARVRQFAALGPGRRAAFVRGLFWLVWVRPALRLVGFRRLREHLERPLERAPSVDLRWARAQAEMIELAGRRGLVKASCLDRSLLLAWLLRSRGLDARMQIGVDRDGGDLRAHAWVECDGAVLGDPEDVADVFFPLEG